VDRKILAPRIEIERSSDPDGGRGSPRFAPEKETRVTSTPLGDPSQPTYGKASRIVLNDACMWSRCRSRRSQQEASSLAADDITINDVERTLRRPVTSGAVMPPQPPAAPRLRLTRPPRHRQKTGQPPKQKAETSVVTADDVYREAASDSFRWRRRLPGERAGVGVGRYLVFLDKEKKIGAWISGDVASAMRRQAARAGRPPWNSAGGAHGSRGQASACRRNGGNWVGATLTITERGRRVEATPRGRQNGDLPQDEARLSETIPFLAERPVLTA
jgi:hypothetical protein